MMKQKSEASSRGATGLSHVPSCCDSRGDSQVSEGESGVSGVDWDNQVFWNGGTTPGVPLDFPVESASS